MIPTEQTDKGRSGRPQEASPDRLVWDGDIAAVGRIWACAPKTHSLEFVLCDSGFCPAPQGSLLIWQKERLIRKSRHIIYIQGPADTCSLGDALTVEDGALRIVRQ